MSLRGGERSFPPKTANDRVAQEAGVAGGFGERDNRPKGTTDNRAKTGISY